MAMSKKSIFSKPIKKEITPPDWQQQVAGGKIWLIYILSEKKKTYFRMSIDHFFRSYGHISTELVVFKRLKPV